MRKLLLGCGIVLLLLVGVFGFMTWKAFQGFQSMFSELASIQENLSATNRRFPFTPPEDGLIAQERFDKWMAVRLPVAKAANAALAELQKQKPGLEIFAKLRDVLARPGNALISSLNKNQMSSAEYRYIAGQMIGALESGDGRARAEAKPLVRAYDQLKNSAFESMQQSQLSLSNLALPVTSGQIRHNMDLMLAREQDMIDSMSALVADAIVGDMTKRSTTTQPTTPATRATTAPATMPASAAIAE